MNQCYQLPIPREDQKLFQRELREFDYQIDIVWLEIIENKINVAVYSCAHLWWWSEHCCPQVRSPLR